jgi:PHP family Zn ribbon phosphoesterase
MNLDRCIACGSKFLKPKEPKPYDQFCDNCMTLIIAGVVSPVGEKQS